MVGIVVVSHNPRLSHEVIRFCEELRKEDFRIVNGGGIDRGDEFGTCPEVIERAIVEADQGDGVIVLCDLGSSVINAGKARERIKGRIRVEIADAPLVEGSIVAASTNHPGMKMKELMQCIREAAEFPKL